MYKVLKRTCCAIDLSIRSFVFPCPRCCRSRGLHMSLLFPLNNLSASVGDWQPALNKSASHLTRRPTSSFNQVCVSLFHSLLYNLCYKLKLMYA